MGTLTAGGITVGYDDRGTGEPLLLVHGHPFDRSMWAPQLAALPGLGLRVIAPDLRGYGESSVVPGRTLLEVFARDLAALLDRLGLPRVLLGGLSMGGQIAMEFCRLFPGRVRGLVLADTFHRADTEADRAWRRSMADRLLAEGMSGYADEVLDRMIAPYNVRALPEVAARVRAMMAGAPPEGAAAALRGRAQRPDYRDVLAQLGVPTLVVVGRDDFYTPVSDAEEMHRLVAGSELAVVEGAGHLPNLEQPAEFNRILEAFLTGRGLLGGRGHERH